MAKKASVKITGLGEARDNLLKVVTNATKDNSLLKEIGDLAVQQIRGATRGRKDEYKQPELAPSTVERRNSLIRSGNAFDQKVVKAKTSNLSMSGQLLAALTYRINQAAGEVTLFLLDQRRPYKGVKGQSLENNKGNNQINEDLEAQGRKFLFITEGGRIENRLKDRIVKNLRRAIQFYQQVKRRLS